MLRDRENARERSKAEEDAEKIEGIFGSVIRESEDVNRVRNNSDGPVRRQGSSNS